MDNPLIAWFVAALFALLYVRQTLRIARLRATVAKLRAAAPAAALICIGIGIFAARRLATHEESTPDV